jgi:hypothetical protein
MSDWLNTMKKKTHIELMSSWNKIRNISMKIKYIIKANKLTSLINTTMMRAHLEIE